MSYLLPVYLPNNLLSHFFLYFEGRIVHGRSIGMIRMEAAQIVTYGRYDHIQIINPP
jgi:hypothetical protein